MSALRLLTKGTMMTHPSHSDNDLVTRLQVSCFMLGLVVGLVGGFAFGALAGIKVMEAKIPVCPPDFFAPKVSK